MSIPNELVQGVVDIKTAIENMSAETPVVIPDREYPDELCEALGDIKTAIENKTADTPVEIPDREYPDELCEALGAVKTAIENSESGGGVEAFEGTLVIKHALSTSSSFTAGVVTLADVSEPGNPPTISDDVFPAASFASLTQYGQVSFPYGVGSVPNIKYVNRPALIDGCIYLCLPNARSVKTCTGGTVEKTLFANANNAYEKAIKIKPTTATGVVTVEVK